MRIYHIVLPDVWQKFADEEFYEAESLRDEGFIHCSFAQQVADVLERYYAGVESVVLLTIDTEKLSAKLVEEPSTNSEIYPHVYGPINRQAIIEIKRTGTVPFGV